MKILILILVLGLTSCSKDDPENRNTTTPIPAAYLGTYNNSEGDTVYVTESGDYASIRWCDDGGIGKYTFDSVMVSTDNSFTVNEQTGWEIFTPPFYQYSTAVGTGSFGSGTMQFAIDINPESPAHLVFSGVKRP